MAQPGFIFGAGTADTYESLQAKRKTAERLGLAAMRTPQNLGEGLSSLGQAIAYRRLMGQADRGDAAGRAASDSAFAQIMAGMGGMGGSGPRISSSGTWSPDAPAPKPTDLPYHGGSALNFPGAGGMDSGVMGAKGDLDFGSATMTPQEMLTAGAEARGLNPIDVATAISYETGGKFDPMISGPTTQWGTHQGLIQFGEPQAAEHGADFTDPTTAMRSQLDPTNGAVWSYLDKAGVKPGMGLDDVYSAINAGAPGRYGASDANNGGAPGTVADKVAGMGDHRGTAADWLGGTWTPSDNVTVSTQGAAPQGGGASIPALMEAMSDPYASEAQKSVLGMLLQQQLTAMQPQSEEDMLRLQQLRIQTAEMQNPGKKDPIEVNGVLLDPDTYEPLYDGRTPDAPKNPQIETFYDEATGQQYKAQWDGAKWVRIGGVQAPDGPLVTFGGEDPAIGKLSTDYTYLTNPDGSIKRDENGLPMSAPVPGSPAYTEAQETAKKTELRDKQAAAAASIVLQDIDKAIEQTSGWTAGAGGALTGMIPGSGARDLEGSLNTIKANIGFDRLQQMREASPTGGALGGIAVPELVMLQAVLGSITTDQSPEQLRANLKRLKEVYEPIAKKAAAYPNAEEFGFFGGGTGAPDGAAPPAEQSDEDFLKSLGLE